MVADAVAVLYVPVENVGDRLDPPVRMPWEPGKVVIRVGGPVSTYILDALVYFEILPVFKLTFNVALNRCLDLKLSRPAP